MSNSQQPVPGSLSVWLATGLRVGLVVPAPGTVGALIWGMPLAWSIGLIHGWWWQLLVIVILNLVGIPLSTRAGNDLGGTKDNQAIVWDEIVTVPMVFLIVPFLTNWWSGIAGFVLIRLFDIWKPPPARQLERLPNGLGIMADDWVAGIYACLALALLYRL